MDQTGDLWQASVDAADSAVDFTQFTHIAIVFPTSGCSYGGISTIGIGAPKSPGKGNLVSSMSGLPLSPTATPTASWLGVVAHELGHALGLSHSNSEDYDKAALGAMDDPGIDTEYGDLFSTMGNASQEGQYPAQHKSLLLGWMNPGGFLEVTRSGTFNVQPMESTGDPRALRILRDAASSAWIWLEYKQPDGDLEAPLSEIGGTNIFKGASLHYESPLLDPLHTYLLDLNPVSAPNSFSNSALLPGSSWSDPYSPLSITVNSANSSGLSVTVNYDQPCAALQFSATAFVSSGGSGTITVKAPSGCAWTASTQTSWISLAGFPSGQGNGSVAFTASANSGSKQRTGYIAIGRQSTAIVEDGAGVSVRGVSPVLGSGTTGQFTFEFSDPNGFSDVTGATLSFLSPGNAATVIGKVCQILANPGQNALYLTNDAGNGSLGPLLLSSANSVSNASCTVRATGSSIAGAGNVLRIKVQIDFASGFIGSHRIAAAAAGKSGSAGTTPLGTWVVPVAAQPSVTIQASIPGAPFSVDNNAVFLAPASFYWSPGDQHTIAWVNSAPWQAGSYSFQSWADGGPNPRTITASSSSATYRANIAAAGLGYLIQTLAGGQLPATSAAAISAAIPQPTGVAVDGSGNIYFSGSAANAVFRIDPRGALTRLAGTGISGYSVNGGPALEARLNNPQALAVDKSGNVYIADSTNQVVRMVDVGGVIRTVAGSNLYGAGGDGGPATMAQLAYPNGVAVDGTGNIFIADTDNHRVRKVGTGGNISTVAGTGTSGFSGDGGPASQAQLNFPYSVAVDSAGNLYIADTNNERIRKVDSTGTISTFAGNGTGGYSGDGGQAKLAQFNSPLGVAVDASGRVYVADQYNHRIRVISTSGVITTVAGNGSGGFSGDGGPATAAQLNAPQTVWPDSAGYLYVADNGNQKIRRIAPDGTIGTVAGSAAGDGGLAPGAGLNQPYAVVKDSKGNIYIADTFNNRVRRIAPGGVISTIAGTGVSGYSGDHGPGTGAQLNQPSGLAVDAAGNVFIADTYNDRVRELTPDGTITTFAGNGRCCDSGNNGPAGAAQLGDPVALALDASGNLYIAELTSEVRKVSASGLITTVAGNGSSGYSGDGGPAVNARLNSPHGLAVDGTGNLYIADTYNSRVRKVSADGTINTVAGTGTFGYSGDGGLATAAKITYTWGIAFDSAGNLYIADGESEFIREVTANGIITTVAGTGSYDYAGDGNAATQAAFRNPQGLAIDGSGSVLVADTRNNAVRLLTPGTMPVLGVTSAHSGSLAAGESGAYTLLVSNALFASPSKGSVIVTETPPASATIVSMSGPGWNCGSGNACSRSDSVSGGSFPPITVAVNIGANAPTQMTNVATVTGGGAAAAAAQDLTQIIPFPGITPGGVVNAATYTSPVAAGSIAAVFGAFQLTASGFASAVPLPLSLAGLTLQFSGGFNAPLFAATTSQTNIQIPWELEGQTQATLSTVVNGSQSTPVTVNLAPFAPSIFTTNQAGTGQGIVQDSSYKLVDASNPATSGSTVVVIYCTRKRRGGAFESPVLHDYRALR